MREVLSITGAIGSGKTTFANFLALEEPNSVHFETRDIIIEIGIKFNELLAKEVIAEPEFDKIALANRVLTRLSGSLATITGHRISRDKILVVPNDTIQSPELYLKLFVYLDEVIYRPEILAQKITADNKRLYRALLQWLGGYLVAKIDPLIWQKEVLHRIDTHSSNAELVITTALRYPAEAEFMKKHGAKIVAIERPGEEIDNQDVTERERSKIVPDVRIINDGSLKTLRTLADRLVLDLQSNNVQAIYKI